MTNVVIREDKTTGELVLFFANWHGREWWLECYTRKEGHSEPSRAYMQTKCRPCTGARMAEAAALAGSWNALPGGDGLLVRIVSQVRGPRALL